MDRRIAYLSLTIVVIATIAVTVLLLRPRITQSSPTLLGRWASSAPPSRLVEFSPGNAFAMTTQAPGHVVLQRGTYVITGSSIAVTVLRETVDGVPSPRPSAAQPIHRMYQFSVKGDTFVLTNGGGDTVTFVRQA